jgi:carbamoylphosphate synthase large subunit
MKKYGFEEFVAKNYNNFEEIEYPCIVKRASGGAGKGVYIAYNKSDLQNLKESDVISEYLPGRSEYVTTMFTKNNNILKSYSFKKVVNKELYIFQQESDVETKAIDNQFLDIFLKIVSKLSDGQYCQCSFNYKIINNTPKIFEINPRMGYTLSQFHDRFEDFIECYINEANNG